MISFGVDYASTWGDPWCFFPFIDDPNQTFDEEYGSAIPTFLQEHYYLSLYGYNPTPYVVHNVNWIATRTDEELDSHLPYLIPERNPPEEQRTNVNWITISTDEELDSHLPNPILERNPPEEQRMVIHYEPRSRRGGFRVRRCKTDHLQRPKRLKWQKGHR